MLGAGLGKRPGGWREGLAWEVALGHLQQEAVFFPSCRNGGFLSPLPQGLRAVSSGLPKFGAVLVPSMSPTPIPQPPSPSTCLG